MASLQQIQSRRKAVKNVGQITKAMEVVAATKMRKSQESALRTRPYARYVLELLERMLTYAPITSDLAKPNPGAPRLVVMMTSDRGLIGSFNTQVLREAEKLILPTDVLITVGRKATAYAARRGLNIVQSFEGFGEFVFPHEVEGLTNMILEGYLEKKWGRVTVIFTNFITTLKQEVITRDILPLEIKSANETTRDALQDDTYLFEPTPEEAINALLPHLVRMELYDFVLEANASEHSARRVAMKTASDNASDLSGVLTLEFNKARQAGITREIIEITSTQNALT